MKNISIFCGAHEGKNPKYAEDAKLVSEIIAKKGINIVFGGVMLCYVMIRYVMLRYVMLWFRGNVM